MVAYNFKARFAPDVEARRKTQTIRPDGKRKHARQGVAIQLYTGMRTKDCRKLGEAICSGSTRCTIDYDRVAVGGFNVPGLDAFAQADGFHDFVSMAAWFEEAHGLPFHGTLIKWQFSGDSAMTPETIQQSVDDIRAMQRDPETAHAAEQDPHRAVLGAIAGGLVDDPAECARVALTTAEMTFPRWCA